MDQNPEAEVLIEHFPEQKEDDQLRTAHRDNNYLFILVEKGSLQIMVDFNEFVLGEGEVLCVLPGQVHRGTMLGNALKGCGVAIRTAAIPQHVRDFFEHAAPSGPKLSSLKERRAIKKAIELLELMSEETGSQQIFEVNAIRSATGVLANLFAQIYERFIADKIVVAGRDQVITQSFRTLLRQHFKVHKLPSFYAEQLHISVPYLNQAVRQTTGMPVSYWIHAEIIMEAKRMLFHTNLSSKEIAFSLGFDDHTYFTRFFTKKAGATPIIFRTSSRQ